MIAIFRKSAVDLRKNARDRPCIAPAKKSAGMRAGRPPDSRPTGTARPPSAGRDRPAAVD
ncbi:MULTISPECIES: hypothetical protein [Burkholderia]|uniref:Uncharacterized protein n=2 Tax=Burkholderia cepacia complex TaxID=87882 RepID=A0A8A8D3H3_9BURK|nr:hypothetical protein [Burkholderia seminalis]MBN3739575.1 hypothetical protein [Burkholderia sp. Tr-20355]QTO19276.1 hypothetical protein DT99_003260 [Burkholderia seminalis]RQS72170.1 hypothetical protein DF032_28870 [Burkholderia seminalis]